MSILLISLMALVNQDDTILNSTNFPLPAGVTHENLDPLLLAETAELELLYPEPSTLKTVIKAWATVRGPAWSRMIQALTEEYNPLHNYDRLETWTDSSEKSESRDGSSASSSSGTGSTSGSGTDTTTVAGFNDQSNLVNKDRVSSSTSANSSSSSDDESEYSETTGEEGLTSHEGRIRGNIGVTTSAQMLAGELEIRREDIYKIITKEFIQMFCLGVY